MDEIEAGTILAETLTQLRRLKYEDLVAKYLDEVDAYEVHGDSGAEYQIEVQGFWDNPRKNQAGLRVIAAIDDGRGWRSLAPLTDSFIMAPDGTFTGE